MNERNCELLFEYLKSILYDFHVQPLDITCLDEPFVRLGKGLQYLDGAIQEMKMYSADLSKGNLSGEVPARDNFLCENLKNLQASLAHLTWQAKQVAKGDYSQKVSFLGEFSEAFNTMTAQLKEREQALKEEAVREKNHAEMAESYNQLLQMLLHYGNCDFLVTSADDARILYRSSNNITEEQGQILYQHFLRRQALFQSDLENASCGQNRIWEVEDKNRCIYQITTNPVLWQGEQAYVNIILDVTKERIAQGELEQRAYYDKLTKIGNRHYFYWKADELLKSGNALAVCYCDLDHLKYINDTYGHKEGDNYMCSFVSIVKKHIREDDVFARVGGDEFCLIFKNCPKQAAEQKLERVREKFREKTDIYYDRDFCFGIIWIAEEHEQMDIEELIQQADRLMYIQKKKHHEDMERKHSLDS